MKYRAKVADAKTGREFETSVPGVDEQDARMILRQRGLLISTIEPMVEEASGTITAAGGWVPPADASRPPARITVVDRYPAMTVLSSVLGVIAILSYLGALIGVVAAFAVAFDEGYQRNHPGIVPSAIGVLSAQLFFSGLIIHAIAHALVALRDIATNSFND